MIGNLPVAGLKTLHHRSDWNTARLKFLFQRVARAAEDEAGIVTAFRDGVVTLRSNRREDGFTFAEKEIGYQGVKAGDLVIHAMDGFAGAIGVSDSDGKVSPVLTVLTPTKNAFPKFWGYYLRSLALSGFITSLAKGIRERSTDFRWKDAGNLLVNYPDLPTQRAIADFLDRETARIDTLIEKKQRLVELLGEKRNAAISHGLLQFPLNKKLKHSAIVLNGYAFKSEQFQDDGVPVVRQSNLKSGKIEHDGRCYPSHLTPTRFLLKVGDLCVGMSGSIENFGIVQGKDLPAGLNQRVAALRANENTCRQGLLPFYVQSRVFKDHISSNLPSTTIVNIDSHLIANAPFPEISLSQQDDVIEHLEQTVRNSETLTAKTNSSIDRLKEYRSALITSAVTGQIDVTKWTNAQTTDRQLDAIEEEFGA